MGVIKNLFLLKTMQMEGSEPVRRHISYSSPAGSWRMAIWSLKIASQTPQFIPSRINTLRIAQRCCHGTTNKMRLCGGKEPKEVHSPWQNLFAIAALIAKRQTLGQDPFIWKHFCAAGALRSQAQEAKGWGPWWTGWLDGHRHSSFLTAWMSPWWDTLMPRLRHW